MATSTVPTNPTNINFPIPTTYVDGSPLPPSDITGIKISVGAASGQYTKSVEDTALTVGPDGLCHYPIAQLGLGQGTWFAALFTDVKSGLESAASNEVSFVIATIPNPPGPVSVS